VSYDFSRGRSALELSQRETDIVKILRFERIYVLNTEQVRDEMRPMVGSAADGELSWTSRTSSWQRSLRRLKKVATRHQLFGLV
jgi:hypothetical protein